MPRGPMLLVCMLVGSLVGAAWSLIPAMLKARYGVNEIITTLMMSFLGTSLANVLIKLVFRDPDTTVPQTRSLAVADRLPRLFGTTIHCGLLLAIAAVILVHLMMTRNGVRFEAASSGSQPLRRRACRIPGGAADDRRVCTQCESDRSSEERSKSWGCGARYGRTGTPAFGLLVVPAGISGALQRVCRHWFHAVFLGADGGR